MSRTLKKGLIMTLTAILAVLMMIIVATNVNLAKADAIAIPDDVNAPRVSGEWTDDFYVKDGASVRLETEGLKFTTIISKAYLQELTKDGETVEFFATAKKLGGTAQAVAFKYQPQVATMKDTFNLNTYLNFDNISDEDMAVACATDFVVETYAKITKGSDVSYVRAYKPENNDIARSMQAVANAHYLESGDEALKTYFTEGNRSNNKEVYVFSDNSGVVEMAKMPAIVDPTSIKVYYGTEKLNSSYSNGKITFEGIEFNAEQTDGFISVFADGKVYSSKVAEATKIAQSNVTDLLSLTGNETVYLAEDIDLEDITWNTAVAFTGTFDGGNHAIKNLTTQASNGFFNTVAGTIKNVAFVDANTGTNSAVIAQKPIGTLTLENVFIDLASRDVWCGATLYTFGDSEFAANMNNVLVSFPDSSSYYNLFGYLLKGLSTLNNVHVINGSGKYARENDYTLGYISNKSTTSFYSDVSGYATANPTLTSFLDSCANKYAGIVKITQANADELLKLSGNKYVYLADDIDLSEITWATTVAFDGTFDGNGHSINGLTLQNGSGLFKSAKGTIKNVVINITSESGGTGGIAHTMDGELTLDSVCIKLQTRSGIRFASLVYNVVHKLTLNKVAIVMPSTTNTVSCSFVAANAINNLVAMTDSYFIAGNGRFEGVRANSDAAVVGFIGDSDYTFYPDVAAFKTAVIGQKILPEFIEKEFN